MPITKMKSSCYIYIGFWFLNFTYAILGRNKNFIYILTFLISSISILLTLTTDLFISGYVFNNWGVHEKFGPLFTPIMIIAVAIPSIYSAVLIYNKIIKTDDINIKKSLTYIFASGIICLVACFAVDIVVPLIFDLSDFPLVSSTLTVILTSAVYGAVKKYNFLAIGIDPFFVSLFDKIEEAIILINKNEKINYMNQTARKIFKDHPSKYMYMPLSNYIKDYQQPNYNISQEIILQLDDLVKIFSMSYSAIFDNNMGISKMITLRDITETKTKERDMQSINQEMQNLLNINKTKYQLLFENMHNGFAYNNLLVNNEGKPYDFIFLNINTSFEKMMKVKKADIIGKKATQVIQGLKNFEIDWIEVFGETALSRKYCRFEQWIQSIDKWVSITVYSPEKYYFATIFEDITERKKTEEKLTFLAYYDQLTKLPNRKAFLERLEDSLNLAERSKKENLRALLLLDLDNFKDINNIMGHDNADQLLIEVSDRLKKSLRKTDLICHLGGDEFAVILNKLTNVIDAGIVADNIIKILSAPFYINNIEVYITQCIGISVYPLDADNIESIIKNANTAIIYAKKDKNKYYFYTDKMNTESIEKIKLHNNLRKALEKNEFFMEYQPLVNKAFQITGVEALLRWKSGELGLVPPFKFIPIAEETGLIKSISKWVMQTVCNEAKEWMNEGYNTLKISINLSARQFNDIHLVNIIDEIIEQAHFNVNLLNFEITESCVIEYPEEAIIKMNSLKSKGISFSLDDFGTGYSSLSYINRYPIEYLKIDRSFIKDIPQNYDNMILVKGIIMLAHNLKLKVVAEGIELIEQHDFLNTQNCDELQGFYYSRPIPKNHLMNLLRQKAIQPNQIIPHSNEIKNY